MRNHPSRKTGALLIQSGHQNRGNRNRTWLGTAAKTEERASLVANISICHETGHGFCTGAGPDAGKRRDSGRIIRPVVAADSGTGISRGMSETQKERPQKRIRAAKGTQPEATIVAADQPRLRARNQTRDIVGGTGEGSF
jgi:hypothetical protein